MHSKRITNTGRSQRGQTLMELVVVLAVSIIIIGALVFATISSLRNAQFAKNQSQATKLAQEALERVRSARDRNSVIQGFTMAASPITSWDDPELWSLLISDNCIPNCYFKLNGNILQYLGAGSDIPAGAENPLGDGKFKRVIILSDEPAPLGIWQVQKTVTVIVQWKDFSGPHESKLTSVLRKI